MDVIEKIRHMNLLKQQDKFKLNQFFKKVENDKKEQRKHKNKKASKRAMEEMPILAGEIEKSLTEISTT